MANNAVPTPGVFTGHEREIEKRRNPAESNHPARGRGVQHLRPQQQSREQRGEIRHAQVRYRDRRRNTRDRDAPPHSRSDRRTPAARAATGRRDPRDATHRQHARRDRRSKKGYKRRKTTNRRRTRGTSAGLLGQRRRSLPPICLRRGYRLCGRTRTWLAFLRHAMLRLDVGKGSDHDASAAARPRTGDIASTSCELGRSRRPALPACALKESMTSVWVSWELPFWYSRTV